MSEYRWIRYRHNTSSSAGRWEYAEVHKSEIPRGVKKGKRGGYEESYPCPEVVSDLDESYSWSEHHRGIEWETIPNSKVPRGIVENRIKNLKAKLIATEEAIKRMNELAPKTKKRYYLSTDIKNGKIVKVRREIFF